MSRGSRAEYLRRTQQIKLARGCEDPRCFGFDPDCVRALHFDHRPGTSKLSDVGTLIKIAPWEVIEAEIAKCDVVCANCHARRTAERPKPKYSDRARPDDETPSLF